MVNELGYKSTTDHGRYSRRVFAMDLWIPTGDTVITDLGWDVRWFEASFWFYGSSCRILLMPTFRCWSLFMVLVFISDLKIILSSILCDQASEFILPSLLTSIAELILRQATASILSTWVGLLPVNPRTDTEEIKEGKMKILGSESFLYFRNDAFP